MVATDLISVLIPAYNVEKYLGRCLRSVLKQTYRHLEIVVVDDGSTDGTYAVAQSFAARDPRVVLLRKPNEGNIAKTRNFLLDHCHGRYCVWVDSDDRVQPRYVEKLYQALTTHGADMSVCQFRLWVLPYTLLSTWPRVRVYDAKAMVPQMIFKRLIGFVLWNKMYRTDLLMGPDGVRFDPVLRFGEDLMFNLQYLRRARSVVCFNQKLYHYSWRSGSEVHKKFSTQHIDFVNTLLASCVNEPDPLVRDTLRAWAAFSCCGLTFLANQGRYPGSVDHMKHFAGKYRQYLYKNRLAKPVLKFTLWIGLKTWCRPRTTHKTKH